MVGDWVVFDVFDGVVNGGFESAGGYVALCEGAFGWCFDAVLKEFGKGCVSVGEDFDVAVVRVRVSKLPWDRVMNMWRTYTPLRY